MQKESVTKTVSMVGIDPGELRWLRLLLLLLRHSDPTVAELTRQALRYLAESARRHGKPESRPLDFTG